MPRKKTQEEFKKEVKDKYGDEYTVLGQYTGGHNPIDLRHNKCGNIWGTTAPYDFLKPKSNTCPNCSHPSRRKSNSQFMKEVKDLVGDEYTFIDSYQTNMTKIRVKHNKCGHIYPVKPNNFLDGSRCPICVRKDTESKGIKKIKKILSENGIKFYQEVKIKDRYTERSDQCLRYDFYIKDIKMAIEFDGEQHFKPKRGGQDEFRKTQIRDKRKNRFSRIKNIDLLRIPFWEEKNIKNILKEKFSEYGIEIR
jgi:very-short-patch-repair endonuclease